MVELKTKPNDDSVEVFLGGIADQDKQRDSRQICRILQEVTGEEPQMWGSSIIGFGTYHYTYASGREGDWMLAGFSPRKQNLTLYIMAGFSDYATAAAYDPMPLLNRLGKHSTGKACLYIKRLEDVDCDVLRELVEASVKHLRESNP